ncbi:hypothetical protein GBA52_016311 [Prunus armeniaca]|nr:hypothetical protein GBA52_016311 [Prunus armeniaca]
MVAADDSLLDEDDHSHSPSPSPSPQPILDDLLSSTVPQDDSFPQMSQLKREEIVLSWSLSYFYLLRMLFKTMKLLTLLVFFTQEDQTIHFSR